MAVTMPDVNRADITGVLLAGGQARRMGGGDKCLIQVRGRALLDYVIERASDQASPLLLNANGAPSRFDAWGLPVVADVVDGYAGPLAGVLTALNWARDNAPQCAWVASFPTDTPFFPYDLVPRLLSAVEQNGAEIACAASGGRVHPVFALWPTCLREELHAALVHEQIRKIDTWTARYRLAVVDFPATSYDPFFNVNTRQDVEVSETMIDDVTRGCKR